MGRLVGVFIGVAMALAVVMTGVGTGPAQADGGDIVSVCLSRTTAGGCDVYSVTGAVTTGGNVVEEGPVTFPLGPWLPFRSIAFGTGTYPGLNSGTATVAIAVRPFFMWYFGNIYVSDPSAGGSANLTVFFGALTPDGAISGSRLCGYGGNWFLPDPNRTYGCVSVRDLD